MTTNDSNNHKKPLTDEADIVLTDEQIRDAFPLPDEREEKEFEAKPMSEIAAEEAVGGDTPVEASLINMNTEDEELEKEESPL